MTMNESRQLVSTLMQPLFLAVIYRGAWNSIHDVKPGTISRQHPLGEYYATKATLIVFFR